MRSNKNLIYTGLFSILAISGNAYSGSVNDQLNELHTRLHNLEASQQDSTANVQIHSVVEVEYGYNKDYADVASSDIVLATAELAIESSINENVDLLVSLLYEEDDTPLEVDVAVITLHDNDLPVSFSFGQMYVPFSTFDSSMISDPLTLELGEIRESSALLGYQSSGLLASMYVFNGDVEEAGDDDKVAQFGINLGYEVDVFTVGVGYISAISDTDGIQDNLGAPTNIVEQVAGVSAHASVGFETMSVVFEYISALDNFDVAEMDFNGQGAEPSAMNIEFAMTLPSSASNVALAYQLTEEALAMDLPESRIMLVYSTEIYEATSLAFEYLVDSDYKIAEGGTDESANTFTVQLVAEF